MVLVISESSEVDTLLDASFYWPCIVAFDARLLLLLVVEAVAHVVALVEQPHIAHVRNTL